MKKPSRRLSTREAMHLFDRLPAAIRYAVNHSVAGNLDLRCAHPLIRKYGIEKAAQIIITGEGLTESPEDYQE
jgi:hypothetical protein